MTDLTDRTAATAETPIDCVGDPVGAAKRLATGFSAGRRLAIRAPGREDHAHHVAVEFLHPVIAGTVALPAEVVHGRTPRSDEILLVIGDGGPVSQAELVIPETGEADTMVAYHLLWELVQLELAGRPEEGGDSTEFLYPFLDGSGDDATGHLRESAAAKIDESRRLAIEAVEVNGPAIERVAAAIASTAATVVEGEVHRSRILTMGNGGSATDAARAVRLLHAVDAGFSARSLVGDYAVFSALANDLGAARVFARQIEAVGRPGDLVIGFSTSGTSANLLAGFDEAKSRGMTTVGFAGYDGVGFCAHPTVDHTLAVASQSVHRIQEAQAALLDAVIEAVADAVATAGGQRTSP